MKCHPSNISNEEAECWKSWYISQNGFFTKLWIWWHESPLGGCHLMNPGFKPAFLSSHDRTTIHEHGQQFWEREVTFLKDLFYLVKETCSIDRWHINRSKVVVDYIILARTIVANDQSQHVKTVLCTYLMLLCPNLEKRLQILVCL